MISSSRRTINIQDEQESVFDFKKEIERRYKNSFVNKIYSFPRKQHIQNKNISFSSEASYSSLENVSVYELNIQNKFKQKKIDMNININQNMYNFSIILQMIESKNKQPH